MFAFTSIHDYQEALNEGSLSCRDAVLYYLERIHRLAHLNVFVHLYEKEALETADRLDQERRAGKQSGRLHGVVTGIKDVICYKGHPVTAGSRILEGFQSLYHATAVEKMIAEGAIIIGHLNCDEFAMGSSNENSIYGRVKNALDPEKVPGGSSGGSAVAVQASLCMISLGSDTGGSVRQPADFCGVIGLKPTYGRISRYGLIAYASSFDQIGIFGKNIGDLALLLETISGFDPRDATSSRRPVPAYSEGLTPNDQRSTANGQPSTVNRQPSTPYRQRIAVLKQALDHPSLDPEIKGKIRDLMADLRLKGHLVEEISFDLLDYIVPAYYILTTAEASSNLSRFDGVRYGHRTADPKAGFPEFYQKTRSEGFGKEVKRRILLGTFVLSSGYYEAYFSKAQKVRKILTERTKLIFNEFDLILTPTVPTTAFKSGEKSTDPVAMYLADLYTVYANLVGIPGISLPLFTHTNGMPFGIQAMTNQFQELSLLQFSDELLQQYKSYEIPTL
ncbi:MAG TPA: Asp-tRNA(Asn)/Glu-tRNA(Gln) amidotransferase GatCAB subunit A [Chitinophagaceae bacterium]|nr:Asp-tRNA(Asn)/Glu-tRNA(Gln) amidotransferase GatCAB subunit A [Chitinophagaceae bacterium]